VLLDDVVVVQEPVGGGADVERLGLRAPEPLVRVVEDAPRVVQPGEQPRGLQPRLVVALGAGEVAGAGRELFSAEELAADGSGDEILDRPAGAETSENRQRSSGGADVNSVPATPCAGAASRCGTSRAEARKMDLDPAPR
jgi:hypothetical protein